MASSSRDPTYFPDVDETDQEETETDESGEDKVLEHRDKDIHEQRLGPQKSQKNRPIKCSRRRKKGYTLINYLFDH